MSAPDPNITPPAGDAGVMEPVWRALLTAARSARRGRAFTDGGTYGLGRSGALCPLPAGSPGALLVWRRAAGWLPSPNAAPAVHALLDLYLPVCTVTREAPLTVGHLGQGLDGYIATGSGDSNYVTGPENILHLHRMRALCDAVVVGADTVATDDPRLTTRRVPGENPVRVILDPNRRLSPAHRVFSDEEAPTLLVCDRGRASKPAERMVAAEVLGVPIHAGRLDLRALLNELHERQLYSVFIEGGGNTVSSFLDAGLLDRLQIAVAPLVTGKGKPGIRLDARERMNDCLRPPHRLFSMGGDILFDCDLRARAEPSGPLRAVAAGLKRIY